MTWRHLQVAPQGSHHLDADAKPAYAARFDEVLKFHAPGLAPVLRGDQAWHITPSGSDAYAHRFQRTFGFYEGLAAVAGGEGWHHIDSSGETSYSTRYSWCGNFQGGRCTVRSNEGGYFHLNGVGEPAYAARWRYAGDYRDGIAVVQASSGLSTHINLAGEQTHERWFVDLDVFHKRYARARDADGWCHVDDKGRPAYAARFAAVEPFYNGQARVERMDGALVVIDELGQILQELRPSRCTEFAALSADMVGFWRTQTIAAAVELHIFDLLPAASSEIALRRGLSQDRTTRLLRALQELRLVSCDSGRWTATARGNFLRRDHAQTLADAALEYAGPFTDAWRELSRALEQGTNWVAPDVFAQVAADDHRRVSHHRMLKSYAEHDYPPIVDALDIGPSERVIDAAGGTGTLARLLLEAHPDAIVTVLDLAEVVHLGSQVHADSDIRWHAASVFHSWGVEADVIVLARVLHDWDDSEALLILERARQALAPGGRILIAEMLLRKEESAGALCDLHLLMATGGRERSAEDFRQLLASAGLRLHAVRQVAALPAILVAVVQ